MALMSSFICSSNNNIPRISQMVHKLCDNFSPPLSTYTYPKGAYVHAERPDAEADADAADAKRPEITYHAFPSPTRLASDDVESRLRDLGFGYRARYVAGTAQLLCEQATQRITESEDRKPNAISEGEVDDSVYAYLHSLRNLSYEEAREELRQFPGIGPKVAECVVRSAADSLCSCILLMALDQHSSIPVDRHVFQFAERWYGIRNKRYEEVADRLRKIWGDQAGWAHTV